MMNENRLIEKNDAIPVLKDLRSIYANVHNHKETSAWAAVALYVVLLFNMLSVSKDIWLNKDAISHSLITIIILIFAFIVWFYTKEQLRLKSAYADIVHSCHILILEITRGNCEISVDDFEPHPDVPNLKSVHGWHFLPLVMLKIIKQEQESGAERKTARAKIEKRAFALIIFATLVACGTIWLAPLTRPTP